jgi:hypothetical protein
MPYDSVSSKIAIPRDRFDVPFHTHVIGCDEATRAEKGKCGFYPPSRTDLWLSFIRPEKQNKWQALITPQDAFIWRSSPGATESDIKSLLHRITKLQKSVAKRKIHQSNYQNLMLNMCDQSKQFEIHTQKLV